MSQADLLAAAANIMQAHADVVGNSFGQGLGPLLKMLNSSSSAQQLKGASTLSQVRAQTDRGSSTHTQAGVEENPCGRVGAETPRKAWACRPIAHLRPLVRLYACFAVRKLLTHMG